jgi:hypothetical protein
MGSFCRRAMGRRFNTSHSPLPPLAFARFGCGLHMRGVNGNHLRIGGIGEHGATRADERRARRIDLGLLIDVAPHLERLALTMA